MYAPKASLIIFKNSDNKILLQKRTADAPVNPKKWGLFGGALKEDETAEEAVRREAMEELGIELDQLKFHRRYEIPQQDGPRIRYVFICPLDKSVDQLRRQQKEGEDLGFFSNKEFRQLDLTENAQIILKDFHN